jgi:hypothetical protein
MDVGLPKYIPIQGASEIYLPYVQNEALFSSQQEKQPSYLSIHDNID